MKYNLIIKYAGQIKKFNNLELNDKEMISEQYKPTQTEAEYNNNQICIEHFYESFDLEIERIK